MKTDYMLRLLIGPDEMNSSHTFWSVFDASGEKDARGRFVCDPLATGHRGGKPKGQAYGRLPPTAWFWYARGSAKVRVEGYRLDWAGAVIKPQGTGTDTDSRQGAIIDIPARKLGRWGDT